jgi:hypothetical protein
MSKRLMTMLLLGLLPVVATAQNSCDALLKGGVFDTSINASTSSGRRQFKQWYCSQDFQSSTDAKKLGLGATIPIDGVPIPFTFDGSQSSFQINYREVTYNDVISSEQRRTKFRYRLPLKYSNGGAGSSGEWVKSGPVDDNSAS